MVKLDVLISFKVMNSEAGILLSFFLIFGDFEPRCSYKIALIKKSASWRGVLLLCVKARRNVNKLVSCVSIRLHEMFIRIHDMFIRIHEMFIRMHEIFISTR